MESERVDNAESLDFINKNAEQFKNLASNLEEKTVGTIVKVVDEIRKRAYIIGTLGVIIAFFQLLIFIYMMLINHPNVCLQIVLYRGGAQNWWTLDFLVITANAIWMYAQGVQSVKNMTGSLFVMIILIVISGISIAKALIYTVLSLIDWVGGYFTEPLAIISLFLIPISALIYIGFIVIVILLSNITGQILSGKIFTKSKNVNSNMNEQYNQQKISSELNKYSLTPLNYQTYLNELTSKYKKNVKNY